MTRKALGKGLSALLGEPLEAAAESSALRDISVHLIDPNPFQPRRSFSEEALKELAASITASGVVQPIMLRPAGERFQVIAGERRLRAAILANIDTIPALVRELADREALEIALTENVLREDLSPLEVAHAYKSLQEKFGYSHEQIAARLGLNRSTVTNTLRLLQLPDLLQKQLESGKISPGHARALLGCPDDDARVRLASMISRDQLSVRQAERMASVMTKTKAANPPAPAVGVDPNLRAAIRELERTLGTRVRISGSGQRGQIEIAFYSGDDLNRLFDWITRK